MSPRDKIEPTREDKVASWQSETFGMGTKAPKDKGENNGENLQEYSWNKWQFVEI